jgi:folylpolyglutamate synthase/dihydropteroate synthase
VNTGAFTSPELHSYTERITCGGVPVSEAMFAAGIAEALEAAKRANVTPTEFEILTAAALWLFRECGVEAAVLEVGMGGRWDATSVVDPKVAVVTGVALDHTSTSARRVRRSPPTRRTSSSRAAWRSSDRGPSAWSGSSPITPRAWAPPRP